MSPLRLPCRLDGAAVRVAALDAHGARLVPFFDRLDAVCGGRAERGRVAMRMPKSKRIRVGGAIVYSASPSASANPFAS